MRNGPANTVASSVCRVSLLLLAAAFASSALADTALQPHSAEYKVKISVLGGRLNTELKTTANGYVATHEVKATGMSRLLAGSGVIRDTSEFSATTDGVRPTRFMSEDSLSRDKENAAIDFDWQTGEARGTVNGENVVSTLQDLAHDRISIQYELMLDLINGSPSAEYILYDIDELKTLIIRNIGTRQVKVPAGTFTAVGIQHQRANSKRVTTLWCVEELDYLPVIIEQHRDGKLRLRATLRKYEPIQS